MTDDGPAQYPWRPVPGTPPDHAWPGGHPADHTLTPGNPQPAGDVRPSGYGQPFETMRSPSPDPNQGYPAAGRCRRCQRELIHDAVACAYCGERIATAATPTGPFIIATGRLRRAGYFVCGGGGAIAISVLLPWVSVAGIASANLSGGGAAVLLALAAGLIYLGTRVLQDRIVKKTLVALWVVAAIDLLLVLILFAAVNHADGESGGLATPAAGFYIAIAGLIAATAGTIMVQRSRPVRGAPAPYLSSDRSAWWDGQTWRDATQQAPPGHPRSPDGRFWWDGTTWRPVLPS